MGRFSREAEGGLEGLARGLYWLTWGGLLAGMGLQVLLYPPRGWQGYLYPVFLGLFLLALRAGPREAPRRLVPALGAYFLFELGRVGEAWVVLGFWTPSLYLLVAFGYRGWRAVFQGAAWAFLFLLLPLALGRGFSPTWAHFALAQPVLLALTLLLARFRELYGQVRFWRDQALTDPLTGLPNRRAFERALLEELKRAERYGYPLSLAVLDLQGFKAINDRLGHATGDLALIKVAEALSQERRNGDRLFRWGGDEFAALFPHTGKEGALAAAFRYARAIEALCFQGLCLGVNIGLATYPEDGTAPDALLTAADSRMYQAKAQGLSVLA